MSVAGLPENRMNDPIGQIFEELPADLREDLDAAFGAYGIERLRNLLINGTRPPEECEYRGVPRHRWQDAVIEDMIPEGAAVLDLGCGRGDLLGKLMRDKGVVGQGVEMDFEGNQDCPERQKREHRRHRKRKHRRDPANFKNKAKESESKLKKL